MKTIIPQKAGQSSKMCTDSIENVDEIPDKFVGIVLQNLQEAIDNLRSRRKQKAKKKTVKSTD